MSLILHLQRQLQEVDELVANLERDALAHRRPSIAVNIRALQKERRKLQAEFDSVAMREESAIYKYRVLPRGRTTISAFGSAWKEFQELFSATYLSLLSGGARSKGKKKVADFSIAAPEFAYGYSFHGAVGVALTLPRSVTEGMATGIDSTIEQATKIIFDIAKAQERGENIRLLARKFGPDVVAAMHKWAEVHTSAGFGVGIEWQMEGLTRDSVVLQLEQIQRLQSDLAQTTFESEMKVTGDLVLVDIDDRTFRLRGDGRAEYSGTFNEGIIGPEHRAVLPARYEATIKAITKAVPTDGEEEAPRHVLVALDPL